VDTSGSRGSPGYRAPELVREMAQYSTKTDIWSLGCILYELVTYRRAFLDDFAVFRFLFCPAPLPFDVNAVGDRAKAATWQLISRMLDVAPSNRPSADDLSVIFGALTERILKESTSSVDCASSIEFEVKQRTYTLILFIDFSVAVVALA
jgi:serine/threonine protein kinase